MNNIMTIEEISEYLKTSKYTIYRLIREKAIPASRLGGQWRFQKNQVDQWFSNQCITKSKERNITKLTQKEKKNLEEMMINQG